MAQLGASLAHVSLALHAISERVFKEEGGNILEMTYDTREHNPCTVSDIFSFLQLSATAS